MTGSVRSSQPLRVLIVDDEPPARRRMRSLLKDRDDVVVCGEAAHGGEAIELLRKGEADIVLLDIQLPVASGIEVVEAVGVERMPLVIFVTAYDEFAIRAFELNAVDYLLKPVDPARVSEALDRAATRLRQHADGREALRGALEELQRAKAGQRIPVREDGRIRFVDVNEIDYVVAEGNYVRLRAGGANHLIRETLSGLEDRLAAHGFLRIHRAILVQVNRIVELAPMFHGAYSVKLKDGTRLVSGRTYRDKLRQALTLDD